MSYLVGNPEDRFSRVAAQMMDDPLIKMMALRNKLKVNEKLPPIKFRYFETYKISFKNCSFIYDSGQQQIDLEIFKNSTSIGTMVHVCRHTCTACNLCFSKFSRTRKPCFDKSSCLLMPLTSSMKTPPNWFQLLHLLPK